MKLIYTRHVLALFAIFLYASVLPAQPYQMLYAYNSPLLETGPYADVSTLPIIAFTGVNTAAIGTGSNGSIDGWVSLLNQGGMPLFSVEFRNLVSGNPVQAEAIVKTPSGDFIACFFDPIAFASDIVRITPGGVIVWSTRLPRFHVKNVDADLAPYAGGEGIWLTGESVARNAALEGLDFNGVQVFATEYFINSPFWPYGTTIGNAVEFDPISNNLVVVGSSRNIGPGTTDMIVFQTNLGGIWIWGRGYSDPLGNDHYHGQALVAHPGTPGHFTVSFEYSNIPATPLDKVAMMEIDPAGNIIWSNYYIGAGIHAGTNYQNSGVDAAGGLFLTSGTFLAPGPVQPMAYSLSVDMIGNPLQFNDYETAGVYPTANTGFNGMEYNTYTGTHCMAGEFNTIGGGPGWPLNPAQSFWLVAADPMGNSLCNLVNGPMPVGLAPAVPNLNWNMVPLPVQVFSPLTWYNPVPQMTTQCSTCKQPHQSATIDGKGEVNIGYAADRSLIIIEIVGEASAQGTIELTDLQGRVLQKVEAKIGKQYLDASTLSRGIYMLRYEIPGIKEGVKKLSIH